MRVQGYVAREAKNKWTIIILSNELVLLDNTHYKNFEEDKKLRGRYEYSNLPNETERLIVAYWSVRLILIKKENFQCIFERVYIDASGRMVSII